MSPNPIKASGGCGPRTPGVFRQTGSRPKRGGSKPARIPLGPGDATLIGRIWRPKAPWGAWGKAATPLQARIVSHGAPAQGRHGTAKAWRYAAFPATCEPPDRRLFPLGRRWEGRRGGGRRRVGCAHPPAAGRSPAAGLFCGPWPQNAAAPPPAAAPRGGRAYAAPSGKSNRHPPEGGWRYGRAARVKRPIRCRRRWRTWC